MTFLIGEMRFRLQPNGLCYIRGPFEQTAVNVWQPHGCREEEIAFTKSPHHCSLLSRKLASLGVEVGAVDMYTTKRQ